MIRTLILYINSNFSEGLPEFHPYKFSGDVQNFEKQNTEMFFFIDYTIITVMPTSNNCLFPVCRKQIRAGGESFFTEL